MSNAQPDFANVDAQDVLAEEQERQAEQREEQARQGSLLRKIEQRREKKTVHIRVEGAKVPFSPPGGVVDEVEDMAGQFAGVEEEDMTPEEFSRYQELRDRVPEILGDKCKDDQLTAAWWKNTFSNEERQEFLGRLARGGEEGKDADGFREK